MAREVINVGTTANDGTGDPLRSAWIKVNNMTSELYTAIGDGSILGNTPTVSVTPPANNQLAVWLDAEVIEGDANLTWDATTLAVTGAVTVSTTLGVTGNTTLNGDLTIADKIVHSGDTNTAIRFPEADTFAVETAGSERMRIDNSGNVGIGTASPDSLFTVKGQTVIGASVAESANLANLLAGTPPQLVAGWSVPAITWQASPETEAVFTRDGNSQIAILASSTSHSVISFADEDDENAGVIEYDHVADSMSFRTGGTGFDLTIDSSGNVGIGTTSPSYELDVDGNFNVTGNSILGDASSDTVTISGRLQVSAGTTGSPGIRGSSDTDTGFQIGASANTIGMVTGGSERMRITSSGNVGIGTSSPSEALTVTGNFAFTDSVSKLSVRRGNAQSLLDFDFPDLTDTEGGVRFFRDTNTTAARFVRFHVGDGTSDIDHQIGCGGGDSYFQRNSGNFGIGTTSPSTKLHVSGTSTLDGGVNEGFTTVTSSSGNASVDCRDGNVFAITLSENTTFTFDNPPTSGTAYGFVLKVVQDSTARTITWPASVDWSNNNLPAISSGAGEVDLFVFFTHDGGTTWYGSIAGINLS